MFSYGIMIINRNYILIILDIMYSFSKDLKSVTILLRNFMESTHWEVSDEMILAHYECETDKKQSLEEHSFNVANKAREEASLPSRVRGLKW